MEEPNAISDRLQLAASCRTEVVGWLRDAEIKRKFLALRATFRARAETTKKLLPEL